MVVEPSNYPMLGGPAPLKAASIVPLSKEPPLDSLRDALDRLLADYPGIVELAARSVYLSDSDDTRDDWSEQSSEFKELYRSEVRLVLKAVREQLPDLRLAA